MIEFPIAKILEEAVKLWKRNKEGKEEEHMRQLADQLRRTSQTNSGNVIKAEPGSDEDRYLSKMVEKGFLVRVPFGYMLPEFAPTHRGGGLY